MRHAVRRTASAVCVALLALSIAGCLGRGPEARFYTLAPVAAKPLAPEITGDLGVGVGFVRLPDALENDLDLNCDVAHLIDDPDAYVLAMIRGSYIWLDNLLYQEETAARNRSGYTSLYFEDLENRVKDLLDLLLSAAARHVGSYWYTAWIHAGRPNLDEAD